MSYSPAERITCPLFIVGGTLDRIIPVEHARRRAAAAPGEVELLIVEGGGHNADNMPYRYRSQSADWMAAQLQLPAL